MGTFSSGLLLVIGAEDEEFLKEQPQRKALDILRESRSKSWEKCNFLTRHSGSCALLTSTIHPPRTLTKVWFKGLKVTGLLEKIINQGLLRTALKQSYPIFSWTEARITTDWPKGSWNSKSHHSAHLNLIYKNYLCRLLHCFSSGKVLMVISLFNCVILKKSSIYTKQSSNLAPK